MGKWVLQRIGSRFTDLRKADRVGTNFHVVFQLEYTPSRLGRFEETPMLDWSEQITMLEHHDGTWWNFNANMYTHNPTSQTLLVWPRRYIAAYDAANNSNTLRYGSSKLYDTRSRFVPVAELGRGKITDHDKADAVRSYLKRHGGRLVIEIHDTPAIIFKQGKHKERLLRFNCGLVGLPLRAKGEQYLNVNNTGMVPAVTARFSAATTTRVDTSALRKTPPPVMVSRPRNGVLKRGEYA